MVPPGQQGPAGDVKPPSGIALAIWLIGGFLGTIIGAVVVGIAAAGSESAGVTVSYIVAGPVGFGWGGALGALIGYLAFKKKPTHRKIAPVGCGCGCALFVGVGLVVFMTAIFPAL